MSKIRFDTIGVLGLRNTIGVDGRRTSYIYDNFDHVMHCLNKFEAERIYSGGGKGVQKLVEDYCFQMGIAFETIKPVFVSDNNKPETTEEDAIPSAVSNDFLMRDLRIVNICSAMVVFWDGNDQEYREVQRYCLGVAKKPLFSFPIL